MAATEKARAAKQIDDLDHIAVIDQGFLISGEAKAMLVLFEDQGVTEGYKTNKGRKAGTIVDKDVPTLLRTVADLYEQEGSWRQIVQRIKEKR